MYIMVRKDYINQKQITNTDEKKVTNVMVKTVQKQ